METDNTPIIFKAIVNFITALNEEFGKQQLSLKLFHRFISKINFTHEKPMKSIIDNFKNFCLLNEQAIFSNDHELLSEELISYSENIFVNMKEIFALCDENTEKVIWHHLLVIFALLFPESDAKQILSRKKQESTRLPETNFNDMPNPFTGLGPGGNNVINKIMTKVNNNLSETNMNNPAKVISSLLKSGVLTEMINDLSTAVESGEIDLTQMMAQVQPMLSQTDTAMLGNMLNQTENPDSVPDFSSMMGPMVSMMMSMNNQGGGLGGGGDISRNIESQLDLAKKKGNL